MNECLFRRTNNKIHNKNINQLKIIKLIFADDFKGASSGWGLPC